MSLFLATLLPGLVLIALGGALLSGRPVVAAVLKAFPRSPAATGVLFGGGALWFLTRVWFLPAADFGNYHVLLTVVFAVAALLAFKYAPDFLAVRGLAILLLLAAEPLLRAAYMEYQYPQRLTMVTLVYLGIVLGLYLGAVPYRMRDFLEWLFRTARRGRVLGACLLAGGAVLAAVSFTY